MTVRRPIRVLLVDDHAMVREGTAAVLADVSDVEVVGTAGDAAAAERACRSCAPDVCLLDFRIPGGGPALARRLAHIAPATRILVVSAYSQADYVQSMRDAGVAGYVLKDLDTAGLTDAVRQVHAGRSVFQELPTVESDTGSGRSLAEPLTMRELDVLRLVAEGASNREAAASLSVSAKTVEAHLSSVYGKLRVRSRTEAVVTAVRDGIISVDRSSGEA
ncbi:MAG: response regulator transcription factor [Chloroflexota bacterium]|nr:response regulator transcription factor [Chloroflexota bacterium]MDE2921155.1 response regulator transcription factor [Chloroflexota bacterium]